MFSSVAVMLIYFLRFGAFLLSYVSNTHSFPKPLSPKEEEHYLNLSYKGDENAKNILIEHNLRLVAHVVKKYAPGPGYDSDDLVSVGTIGLIKAINSYDGTKKTRLATYAARCIENEILMLMRKNKKNLQEISLNDSLGHDSDGNEVTFMEILPAEDEEIATTVGLNMDIKKLYSYIDRCLEGREREIIILRYGLSDKPYTQREIAKAMGISRSYVSRIEKRALEKLNACFNNDCGGM
ncbi:MAG: RNA polymerase sporulation sigma factor SigK [Clostridia bacterium]|nr:RNA polymerase sporulation sigma factor SigK [Clostridia bacterium]